MMLIPKILLVFAVCFWIIGLLWHSIDIWNDINSDDDDDDN